RRAIRARGGGRAGGRGQGGGVAAWRGGGGWGGAFRGSGGRGPFEGGRACFARARGKIRGVRRGRGFAAAVTHAASEGGWARARRHRRRRAWPVVTLALEKPLFRNVPRKRPVVTLLGEKSCDINKRLDPF